MRIFPFLVAASLALLACESRTTSTGVDAEAPLSSSPGGKTFVTGTRFLKSEKAFPGRYIVVLQDRATHPASTQRVASELASLHGAKVGHVYAHTLQGFVATMPEASARRLSLDPRVRYVEEDGLVMAAGTQASPPWNLDRIDQRGLPLDQSYSYGRTGSGVHVYVLDTGIWIGHYEVIGRSHFEYDGASYSWSGGSTDCNGHGTHVAGIIGGRTYGVAKEVTLHAVRVLGCDGAGYVSDAIRGIDWVTANHVKPAVANMSLSASTEMAALEEAINRAISAGITFVVAAGDTEGGAFNFGADACYRSPARTPAAITVGATTSADAKYSYSNYGGCVDLFAPGHSITSGWKSSGNMYEGNAPSQTASGSSMAAAHVAGAAALYLEANPTATPEEVAQRLIGRATPDKLTSLGEGSPNRLLYAPCSVLEVTPPPQVSLTGPAAGAALSGTVTLTATATDDVGVTKVEFYAGKHLLGTDTSPPYEVAWDTAAASNGPHTVTVRAYDDSCGRTDSAPVDVTLQNVGNATFDPQWQVPTCASVGSRCDSVWLLEGRAGLGPELHAPNTLGGTCADGTNRPDLPNPTLERLALFRDDGGTLAEDKRVTVQATVRANSGSQLLDLYSAADASNPVWTYLTTLTPDGYREQILTTSILLPKGASLQALRGVFRSGGSAQACNPGPSTDHDDLVFAVAKETDTSPPTVAISSPAAGSAVERLITIGVAASDNFGVAGVELYDGANLIGVSATPPFSMKWNTKGQPNGVHRLTARAFDAAGFSTTSAPVDVIVNNDVVPPQAAFLSPTEGESISRTTRLTASASDDRGGSVQVDYFYRVPPATAYTLIGSSWTAPYAVEWSSRGRVSNGPLELFVKAHDQDGNSSLSGPLNVVVDNDYTSPTAAITSPASGATVSGRVSFEAAVSDDRQLSVVYFSVDGHEIGRRESAPYSVTWDSMREVNGSHTLRVTAFDAHSNWVASELTVTTSNPGSAAYDTGLKVPVCTTPADSCDSGRLLVGRGGSEAHAPNTLDGCLDGTSVTASVYRPTIERIRVSQVGGTNLAAGKRVRIEVDVLTSVPANENLSLYYTSDATQPSWTLLTTLKPSQTAGEAQTLSAEYRLPAGNLQAVRANYWNIYDSTSCTRPSGGRDQDDLVFTPAQEPDTTPPSAQLTSPAEGAVLIGNATLMATASDDYDVTSVAFYEGTTLLGTDTSPPYSLTWNTWNTPNGTRSLTAVGRDAAGNAGPSSPVLVTVNNDHASIRTTITSPTEGATLLGTVTISATAGNPSKVWSGVRFYAGTRLLGTAYSHPYSYTWNTAAEPTGSYTLTTRASDSAGNVEISAPVNVIVDRDTTPPTVSITSPSAGDTLRGAVSVLATATDQSQITRVELYVDGSLMGTDTSSPYSISWSPSSASNGDRTLTVKAYDVHGNVGTSPGVGVTVAYDGTPPTVSVLTPAEGATVSETLTLTANAVDDYAMARVEYFVDGQLVGTSGSSAPYGFVWNSRSIANGAHSLVARAYDSFGNMGVSATRSFTVNNDVSPPTASITAPAPGASLRGTVTVTATAQDDFGVTKVEFYVGVRLLGTSTAAPYSASWNTATSVDGAHTLTVRAYDAAGNVRVSLGLGVTVDNTAPTQVAITSPANGASLSALSLSTTIQASAFDNRAVTQVVFYDGASVIGTDTTAPYSVSWNLLGASKGTHTLTVKAHDAAGNVTTSAPISVKVN